MGPRRARRAETPRVPSARPWALREPRILRRLAVEAQAARLVAAYGPPCRSFGQSAKSHPAINVVFGSYTGVTLTGAGPSEENCRVAAASRRSTEEFIAWQKERLPGLILRAKDVGRRGVEHWRCEAVTLRAQSGLPEKVYVILRQRLERVDGERLRTGATPVGDVVYRFGYYIVARNGKWWWSQYAMMIPSGDLRSLLAQARVEGTLLEDALPEPHSGNSRLD